jgi:hypothetical protein
MTTRSCLEIRYAIRDFGLFNLSRSQFCITWSGEQVVTIGLVNYGIPYREPGRSNDVDVGGVH